MYSVDRNIREAHEEELALDPSGPLWEFGVNVIPGIYFESGYCLLYHSYTSTPTALNGWRDMWIITPADERILYIDPAIAGELARCHHQPDRLCEAEIRTVRSANDSCGISVDGGDGTTIELDAEFDDTVGSRIVSGVGTFTPPFIARTRVGIAVRTMAFNRMFKGNGTKLAGRTETGAPYRLRTARGREICRATARYNGIDLGETTAPRRLISQGDLRVPDRPLHLRGKLLLPIPG